MLPRHIRYLLKKEVGRHTDSEAFDCLVLGSTAGTVGAADWFGVATTMLVTTVIPTDVNDALLIEMRMLPSLKSHGVDGFRE
jgi:hypothetical protein